MNSSVRSRWLLLGGIGSIAVGFAHVAAILIGASAYQFMGAPDLALMAEHGSLLPTILTSGLVVLFLLWALYAFSGVGLIRQLPLLRAGNVAIGVIYSLRGLVLIPELVCIFLGKYLTHRMAIFSAISLLIGLFYLLGAWYLFGVDRVVKKA